MDDAIAQYQKALEINPDDARRTTILATALRKRAGWTKRWASTKTRLQLDPGIAEAHYNLGI